MTAYRYLPKELPGCRSICEVGKEFAYLHNLISSSLILAAKRIWWNHKSWGEVLISEAGENIQRLLLCVHAKDFPLKMFFAGTGGEDDKEREREESFYKLRPSSPWGEYQQRGANFWTSYFSPLQSSIVKSSRITIQRTTFINFSPKWYIVESCVVSIVFTNSYGGSWYLEQHSSIIISCGILNLINCFRSWFRPIS